MFLATNPTAPAMRVPIFASFRPPRHEAKGKPLPPPIRGAKITPPARGQGRERHTTMHKWRLFQTAYVLLVL